MKNQKLIIASCVGSCLLATVAISADNGRPAPIRVQTTPVDGGAVAELQMQINQLKSQIADQQKTIDGMKVQTQKIAIGGFANKGDLTALTTQLNTLRYAHNNHYHYFQDSYNQFDKKVSDFKNTTISSEFCKPNGNNGATCVEPK